MNSNSILLGLLVTVLAGSYVARGGEEEPDARPLKMPKRGPHTDLLKSARLLRDWRDAPYVRILPLNANHIVIQTEQDDRRGKRVPVTLVETSYEIDMLRVYEDNTKPTSNRLVVWCYELRSTDPTIPYTRAFWFHWRCTRFRLFAGDRGETYLAWVPGTEVALAEISKPTDRVVELNRFLLSDTQDGVTYVPVRELVEKADYIFSCDLVNDSAIEIVSVGQDEAGKTRVSIRQGSGALPPRTDEVFTLVCEKGKWRKE